MTYTKTGPFTDGGAPYLSAAFFNKVETALTDATTVIAPAPSGGDDTAVLQALLNTAQTTGGTLVLQAGTYKANLATTQSFTQPRILGQGKDQTTLQGTVSTSPVLRMKGGSGSLSGGYLADFTITAATAGGGVGLELADCGGVKWSRLRLTGTLAEGIRFHSEASGGFCEFNSGDVEIQQAVVLPIHYKVTSGNESFHGTGVTRGTVINQASTATGPVVQIDAGCFPYGAPFEAAVFARASTSLFNNASTTRIASFQGGIDLEVQGGAGFTLASTAGARIYFEGGITALNSGTTPRLGNLYLADKVYYNGGTTLAQMRPFQRVLTLTAGTTAVTPEAPGTCMVQIDISAPNYLYSYLLYCWQSPTSGSGTVTVVGNPSSNNTAGLGAPTFSWSSNGLQVANAAYSSSVSAYVTVTPIYSPVNFDRLAQF